MQKPQIDLIEMRFSLMKRLITIWMITALLLVGVTGCKRAPGEGASVDEYVESQTGAQNSDSPQKVEKPGNEVQKPQTGTRDEIPDQEDPEAPQQTPDQENGGEEQPDQEEPAPGEEDAEKDDTSANKPSTNRPSVNKPTPNAPVPNTPSVNNPTNPVPDYDTPEDYYEEEEFPEDEEYPEEDEEEEPEDDEEQKLDYSNSSGPVQPNPNTPTPDKLKIASYNIKALLYGEDTAGIIQELRTINADIVGLQEVDKNTNRSQVAGLKVHQVKMLAEALNYPYWAFDKLIDHSGGEYGMAVLSRYPIIGSSVVQYSNQQSTDHVRKYGRHVIAVGGKTLVFYNTHLCVGDTNDSVSKLQLKEVVDRMSKDTYAVLTGDLNMPATTAATVVSKNDGLLLLNDGGAGTGKIGSKKASAYIDNIVVSKTLDHHWNTSSGTGIEVSETPYSDHNLVYTFVSFK